MAGQSPTQEPEGIGAAEPLDPRLLHSTLSTQHFNVVRYQPRDELRALLSHHAVLEWDLGEREGFAQKALDKPGSGIVWNKRGIALHGPKTELYAYHGQGTGRIYGIKFGPAGERVDMATLAYDLGYSSQSHFSNHFKPMTNTFPSEYVRVRRNSEKK